MHSSTNLITLQASMALALSAILLSPGDALTADHLLTGKKLLIKNPPAGTASNKAVHLSKDPAITVGTAEGAGDPQCTGAGGGGTSSLRIAASGGAGDVTISLPCVGWTTNSANSLYKYNDPTGATCKLVLVKAGVLVKAVCKGAQVAVDLNGAMSPVAVATTLNSETYCSEFGGTAVKEGSDDKTFLRKDAPAPGSCPALSLPTTTTTTTTPTTTITTTTTLPGCFGEGLLCGSCGPYGACLLYCPSGPFSEDPTLVCVDTAASSPTFCDADADCSPGQFCFSEYGASCGEGHCASVCP